jgi:hypothetical protein
MAPVRAGALLLSALLMSSSRPAAGRARSATAREGIFGRERRQRIKHHVG